MPDWLLAALFSGACSGVASWATMRVQLAWLRADVDRAHQRLDLLENGVIHAHRTH